MALPEEAREALALRILDSISSDAADAWRAEVLQRLDEVRSGAVETESWAEVDAHLGRALTR